jgi:AcrR family transcriptional regulator
MRPIRPLRPAKPRGAPTGDAGHYEVALSESESKPDPMREHMIKTTLELAEESGWYNLRLHIVAQRLGVPLEAVLSRFRDADAIADAWFARALQAMLREPEPGFAALSPSERVHIVLMRWFEAQSRHRRVVSSMLGAKLHPSHPHHWVPMIFSLSRLIHCVLEAARLDARGLSRQAEEVGLTLLFLRALSLWLRDETPGQERTRNFLRRNLGWLDGLPRREPFISRATNRAEPERPTG